MPENLSIKAQNVTGQLNIINELNTHFVNISNIITKTHFVKENFSELKCKLDTQLRNIEFKLQPITPFEVRNIIVNLTRLQA